MLALVLLGILIAHSASGASLENSYGNSPSYDSYSGTDASIGSRNGLEGSGGRTENSVENGIGTSASSGDHENVNADWITYRPNQPSRAPLPYSASPSSSVQADATQQIEQQLDVIHNMVTNFFNNFNHPEGTPQYKSNLNAAINAINQKINEISHQAMQHESVRTRFQEIKAYFDNVLTSIRLQLDYIEEEQRLEAEREAERRRSAQVQSTTGGSTSINSGYYPGSPKNHIPQSMVHPDLVAAAIDLQQNLSRLRNEVFQLNLLRMRLNYPNTASVMSEAESTVASLGNRIRILGDTSRKYQNGDIYNHTEMLRQQLEGFVQILKTEASKFNSQYIPG